MPAWLASVIETIFREPSLALVVGIAIGVAIGISMTSKAPRW